MGYSVRKAEKSDLERILKIYANARQFMAENGNPHQWGNTHPPAAMLEADIPQGQLYVVENETGIHGVFAFLLGEDPTYRVMSGGVWRANTPYGTIHRIASDGSGGVFAASLAFCRSIISHIRIDTHEDNAIMQRNLQKQGFSRRGVIYVADGTPRIAYDLI